jgi:hypothetical protein
MKAMLALAIGAAALAALPLAAQTKLEKAAVTANAQFQEQFPIKECKLATTGRNDYFILEPGFQTELRSKDTRLVITVLDETKMVDGVLTRVVEEREWKDGKLYEVARNYFAICEGSYDVYYFGEEVDFYKDGKVVDHAGTWLAGKNNARAGMIMPGMPKVGMRYYQEIAPGVAMDRAEIVKLDGSCKTPAGTFAKCLSTKETTALDLSVEEFKSYAPGIGLISDTELKLTKYGFIGKATR